LSGRDDAGPVERVRSYAENGLADPNDVGALFVCDLEITAYAHRKMLEARINEDGAVPQGAQQPETGAPTLGIRAEVRLVTRPRV
jgi:hypothetical protein